MRIVAQSVLTVVAIALGLYLVYLLRKPISWIVLATFMAIVLSGPVNRLARRMPRGAAIAIVYVGVLLVPFLLALIVVPPFVTEGSHLADHAPQYAADVERWVHDNRTLRELDHKYDITGELNDQAAKLPSHVGDAAGTLSDIGLGLVNGAFALLNIYILSIFLVASGRSWLDRFVAWRRPQDAERIAGLADRIARTFGAYVGGALAQATIAGLTTFAMLEILGVPFAAPLAVITFALDLIPLVGATVGAILVGLVTVFTGFPTTTIIWAVFAIVYQQVENTIIQPQIQRRAVEVHPFAVLVGVLCGATLFGILGALLAIPVIASGQITLREWFAYRAEQGVGAPLPSAAPELPAPGEA